ncbi:MAG: hypothetical protein HKM98_10640 [Gammaproteobacteria bacterium]|nr:hypothetical protein [Gammaproteobacteria bacterium]
MNMRLALTLICVFLLSGCPTGGSDQDLPPPPIPPIPPAVKAVTPDSFLTFDNTYTVAGRSLTDTAAYASAYHAAVDPNDRRTTMAGFKAVNGFDAGVSAHITFRDSKDLGYGRDMYARKRSDGSIAIYVDNYLVAPEGADATQYGPINLDAAMAQDARFHETTNAIEFSPIDESDPTSEKIVKMFTYGRPDANGRQTRLEFSDLDGRGAKSMPTPCFACHGGVMYPLDDDGSFPLITLRSAKMNILDPITFEFAAMTESEQQVGIKNINKLVFDHYVEMDSRAETNRGKWSNRYALELAAGPYGDDFSVDTYDESFVPAGWRRNSERPDGVETLYKEVVEPHCSTCHSLRGNSTAENIDDASAGGLANAVTFSSYERFISYNDDIIKRVYQQGRMPASLLNYSRFWNDPAGPPSLLATFLQGFDLFDRNGNVTRPGRPAAVPGASRRVSSPVIQDAAASVLTSNFSWRIVSSPANASASLSNANSSAVSLSGADGVYVLALTASNSRGNETQQITLTLDSTLVPKPHELDFATDVRDVLNTPGANRSCSSCHNAGSEFTGIPVFFDDNNPDLYKDVLERVNFADPENSQLLRKPANLQHGGGIVLDRAVAEENAKFNTLINWIRNGAPCGSDPQFCN